MFINSEEFINQNRKKNWILTCKKITKVNRALKLCQAKKKEKKKENLVSEDDVLWSAIFDPFQQMLSLWSLFSFIATTVNEVSYFLVSSLLSLTSTLLFFYRLKLSFFCSFYEIFYHCLNKENFNFCKKLLITILSSCIVTY